MAKSIDELIDDVLVDIIEEEDLYLDDDEQDDYTTEEQREARRNYDAYGAWVNSRGW